NPAAATTLGSWRGKQRCLEELRIQACPVDRSRVFVTHFVEALLSSCFETGWAFRQSADKVSKRRHNDCCAKSPRIDILCSLRLIWARHAEVSVCLFDLLSFFHRVGSKPVYSINNRRTEPALGAYPPRNGREQELPARFCGPNLH